LHGARVLSLVGGSDVAPDETLEVKEENKKNMTSENPTYTAWIAQDQ
jgi:hypothetical protein